MMAKDAEARWSKNYSGLDLDGVTIDAASECVSTGNRCDTENGRRAIEGNGSIGFGAEKAARQTGRDGCCKGRKFAVDGRCDVRELKCDVAVGGNTQDAADFIGVLFDLLQEGHV
jgi:hypothetical protein